MSDLLAKYHEMRAMRADDAAGASGDPRPRMRALAARFPGALREIDELSLDTIEARIAALDGAVDDPIAAEPWMIALSRYHALLRLALRIRREVPERSVRAARDWLGATEPGAVLDDALLAALVRPPGGRLSRVVLEEVARELGTSAHEVEHALVERRRGSTPARSPR